MHGVSIEYGLREYYRLRESTLMIDKVVILARGLGKRMRREANVQLDSKIESIANKGLKPLIPIHNRPFLDYSIQEVMKAGFKKICLVVGPNQTEVVEYYEKMSQVISQLDITFAIQDEPLGTSDAVLSAKRFVGCDSFVMMNGDNFYYRSTLQLLRKQKEEICYAIGFDRESLIRRSNFDESRIRDFAVMDVDEKWNLRRIVEKPSDPDKYSTKYGIIVSMNLFRFTPHIFWACSRIEPHPLRGEYEITSAVQYLIDSGRERFKVIYVRDGVLDLTYKSDIPLVSKMLKPNSIEF